MGLMQTYDCTIRVHEASARASRSAGPDLLKAKPAKQGGQLVPREITRAAEQPFKELVGSVHAQPLYDTIA